MKNCKFRDRGPGLGHCKNPGTGPGPGGPLMPAHQCTLLTTQISLFSAWSKLNTTCLQLLVPDEHSLFQLLPRAECFLFPDHGQSWMLLVSLYSNKFMSIVFSFWSELSILCFSFEQELSTSYSHLFGGRLKFLNFWPFSVERGGGAEGRRGTMWK